MILDLGADHLPARPSWNCSKCGDPWPCGPAQGHLTLKYLRAPLALAFYLTARFNEACDDLKNADRQEPIFLHGRFFQWDGFRDRLDEVVTALSDPSRSLAWRNRRIIAERLHWPPSAVETCEQVERVHPRWAVNYRTATDPAGFYAVYRDARMRRLPVHGTDAESLCAGIEEAEQVIEAKEREIAARRRFMSGAARWNPNQDDLA